jgi:glycogen operon protein
MVPFQTAPGSAHPLGTTPTPAGVNFSLFSECATEVVLLLFDRADAVSPCQQIRFDPYVNKSFHFWHVLVRNLPSGYFYAFRVDGPNDPPRGLRFNPNKVLIGPYARAISKRLWSRNEAYTTEDNLATSMRCGIVYTSQYDWEGDEPLKRPIQDTIIYEMHVGGFTRSPSSGVKHPGTFSGVIEKIPYLQALGVTAVELLPVADFDDSDVAINAAGHAIRQYWGYNTVGFFAPHAGYCIRPETASHAGEFCDMVKALHRAGLEVILDVVFNHTDEADEYGPTYSFRGIDNQTYYILDPRNPAHYQNYSGVGNTFNCNHPLPQKFILDCLLYWVKELHVDGFRFDEGSILSRGEDGTPLAHPPVVWQVELDEALSDTKVIAEAWDAAGLYQVGHFPGDRWADWNGRYRDDIRRFIKGDPGMVATVASRIGGSSDVYQRRGQTPQNTINFITCHDGFTLNDLVSYNSKHNEANGEGNRDGLDTNFSWNCGVEGPTNDTAIEALRLRQIKNFLAILLLSRGVPMFGFGDEVRRTQGGNNNAYNQDNPTSWFDWTLAETNAGLLRFVTQMIDFRKRNGQLRRPHFYTGEPNERGLHDIAWHGTELFSPGFSDPQARVLAFTIAGLGADADLHVMINMYWEPLTFAVPANPGRQWRRVIDTFEAAPADFLAPGTETLFPEMSCNVRERSLVLLAALAPPATS